MLSNEEVIYYYQKDKYPPFYLIGFESRLNLWQKTCLNQWFPFVQFAIAKVFKKFQMLKKIPKESLKTAKIENSAIANCKNGKQWV